MNNSPEDFKHPEHITNSLYSHVHNNLFLPTIKVVGSRPHTPGSFSLISVKENRTKRNRSLAGGFYVRLILLQLNIFTQEFALRKTRCVFVAVAVGIHSRMRAIRFPLRTMGGGKSKSKTDVRVSRGSRPRPRVANIIEKTGAIRRWPLFSFESGRLFQRSAPP